VDWRELAVVSKATQIRMNSSSLFQSV